MFSVAGKRGRRWTNRAGTERATMQREDKLKTVAEAHLSDEDCEVEALGHEVGMSRSQIQ